VTPRPCVLTINGGSSSIRFAVYEAGETLRRRLRGQIDRIGLTGTSLIVNEPVEQPTAPRRFAAADHRTAVAFLLDWLEAEPVFASVKAVGHRIVHGMKHSEPERVTPNLLAELHRITPYAPDHLPREIALIEAFRRRHPRLPKWPVLTPRFTAPCRGLPNCCRSRGAIRPGASSVTVSTVCPTPI
jgi:acetate kinase